MLAQESGSVQKETQQTRATSSSLSIHVGDAQHIGSRAEQEDSLGYSNPLDMQFIEHAGILTIVADGLGGFDLGREASSTAVESFLSAYNEKTREESIRDALTRSLFSANDAVLALHDVEEPDTKIGTTIAAAVIFHSQLFWVSVGDTRIYLVRGGNITQISADHVFAAELDRQVQQNIIPSHVAEQHPERDILTSYVGCAGFSLFDCNMKGYDLRADDQLILCSDGLYRTVPPEEMLKHLSNSASESAQQLVKAALEKRVSNQDNTTALVITINSESQEAAIEGTSGELGREISVFYRLLGALFIVLALIALFFVMRAKETPLPAPATKSNVEDPKKPKPEKAKPETAKRQRQILPRSAPDSPL
jgi:serine/threonine protein phosphatase PrpC